MIRTVIVDDEPLAREGVRLRLEREPDFDVVGEAGDGPAAVAAIRSLAPELVFLDVQMPGLSGFDVLEQVGEVCVPMVVFVTAHDAHALQAFDVHALDYLLKPFTEARFQATLARVRNEMTGVDDFAARRRLAALLDTRQVPPAATAADAPPLHRFTVRDRDRIRIVPAHEVEAITAAGNYVELVTPGGTHLVRQTLADVEARLDPTRFARIHRSTIINLAEVREIHPDPHGDAEVVLASGAVYRVSRAYRKRLLPGK
jgi:two-component system LytT family response regulator